MENEIIIRTENKVSASIFDTGILAGTVSSATIDAYRTHWRSYCEFAGSGAAIVESATLTQWRVALHRDGYTTSSGETRHYSINAINQRLAAIRSIIREAAEQGYLPRSIADDFKHVKGLRAVANKERSNPNARTCISRPDMQRIIDAPDKSTLAGKMHHAMLVTLAYVGVRVSEAATMKISDIAWHVNEDGVSGWVVNVAGKNKIDATPRPLAPQAKIAIDAWLAARSALGVESEFIFTSFAGRGNRATNRPISRVSAWQLVQRYASEVGLSHVKPHDFRRFVGTQLARQDIRLAQKQLGHSSISTTAKHYVLDGVAVGSTDNLLG